MSDSEGPKSNGIPSWQRQEPSNLPPQPDNAPPKEQAEQQPPEPRASLIERACQFLQEDSIRNAPIERKKLFLESKGLTETEIDDLLEIEHAPEAAVMEDYGIERREASQSTTGATPQQHTATTKTTTTSVPEERPPDTPSKDTAPIITYPEFLLRGQKPAPLITANRLLTSLYITAGAAATVYGTSKYIVEPMVESLTSARHSLLEGAGVGIDALNKKLESAVSKAPEKAPHSKEEGDSDTDSTSSSDGAPFFSRSAGTQTSPPHLSRSNSSASSDPDEALSPAQDHTSALLGIHSKLSDLLPTDGEPANPLGDSIKELRAYLQKLPHANSTNIGGKAGKKGEIDAVASVKAEIRGVKGVLLSARNFPSGVAAR
ncbi:MAG: hypothetical protein ALECFALPRED_006558 [Alectoria fallacina]|uniref:Peroxisomal membrane protein PEX14 n=1 Tax=Alectoria fallacina TaxID=1903189 RepID=A0A8H3IVV7_9LECA|nr:MAG: hypothetical protein ALECFALPRED_006558 [Alectoria fallacina]